MFVGFKNHEFFHKFVLTTVKKYQFCLTKFQGSDNLNLTRLHLFFFFFENRDKLWLRTHFLRARFRDWWPFPIGVAKGPLSPTFVLSMDSKILGGSRKFPSGPLTGVTSTSSQSTGACSQINKPLLFTYNYILNRKVRS